MTTFQANNAYFGTQALVGASGTTSNTKLSASDLVVTGATVALATTYSGTGIASNTATGNAFDITTKGLTFNALAGAAGNLLLSGGSAVMPTWLASPAVGYYLASGGVSSAPVWTIFPTIPTAYVIQRGVITTLAATTGTVTLTGFTTVPFIVLTVDTLTTNTIVPAGLGAVSTSSFTWVLGTALTAGQRLNYIAIQ
jgi:hypothetical protein